MCFDVSVNRIFLHIADYLSKSPLSEIPTVDPVINRCFDDRADFNTPVSEYSDSYIILLHMDI